MKDAIIISQVKLFVRQNAMRCLSRALHGNEEKPMTTAMLIYNFTIWRSRAPLELTLPTQRPWEDLRLLWLPLIYYPWRWESKIIWSDQTTEQITCPENSMKRLKNYALNTYQTYQVSIGLTRPMIPLATPDANCISLNNRYNNNLSTDIIQSGVINVEYRSDLR